MFKKKNALLVGIALVICAISTVFGALPFLVTSACTLLITGTYLKITTAKDAIKLLNKTDAKEIYCEDYISNNQSQIKTTEVVQDGLNQLSYNFSDKPTNVIEK